jgi:hypothetical protein
MNSSASSYQNYSYPQLELKGHLLDKQRALARALV